MAQKPGRRAHQSINMPTKQQGNRIKKNHRRQKRAEATGSRATKTPVLRTK